MKAKIPLIACGIFRQEFEALPPDLKEAFSPEYLDSMLHMRPLELDAALHAALEKQGDAASVLLFGDCCPFMREISETMGRKRSEGINCCEIMLGHERYKALRREGAFFFMPEWTERWEEVFKFELGFSDEALARAFMQDTMKKLVYIDTGLHPVPYATLAAIERYFELPVSVERAGLSQLEKALREALAKARP
ncbi:MAG TPA: hypothetical protein DCG47_11910 [Spirochaetaceae bacterium]|nr:hypothetical protein [Spirochaetaceae bacterium]